MSNVVDIRNNVGFQRGFVSYLDHIEGLQCRDQIFRLDSSHRGNIANGKVTLGIIVGQQMHQNISPVAAIGHLAQIRKGLFGRSRNAFSFGQFVRERNNEFPISALLILRKCQDTGQVVSFRRDLVAEEVCVSV